ncbi:hypothetical protein N665_0295s0013 [Sinapis alba]|nr:hypothetical protein N665_0295s0013 [Sinapis alba]
MGFCGHLMAKIGQWANMFLLKLPSPGPNGKNIGNHVTILYHMHSKENESKRGFLDAVVDFLHKSGLAKSFSTKNFYPDV